MLRLKKNTPDGNGLELWRKLYHKSNIVTEEYADAIENSPSAFKTMNIEQVDATIDARISACSTLRSKFGSRVTS